MLSKLPVIFLFTVRARRSDGYTVEPTTNVLAEAEHMVDLCQRRGYTAYIHVSRERVRAVVA